MLLGVISDTHGVLHASVFDVFAGVERIVHAGDIGSRRVLDELETIAPVVAVHGNMDGGELAWRVPARAVVRLGGRRVLVGHIKEALLAEGVPDGVDVVISGHTHRPHVAHEGGVLYVNPGAAGASPRGGHPPTVALLDLSAEPPTATIVTL